MKEEIKRQKALVERKAQGDRIKVLREKRGFSQEYIAEKLGVSFQSVQQWEWGKTSPARKRLQGLAELLEVSVEYLVTGSAKLAPEQVMEILELWHEANQTPIDDREADAVFFRDRMNELISCTSSDGKLSNVIKTA